MGSRDYRKPEKKKPKKDAKKSLVTPSVMPSPPPPVEIIKRGKKTVEPEE